jgi:rubredoxin
MPARKDCPLCGGTMRVSESQAVTRVRGYPDAVTRTAREWVCPDCDYFEEAEEGNSKEESNR